MKLLMLLLALTVVFTKPHIAFADDGGETGTEESSDDHPTEEGGSEEDPEF